MRILIWHLHGGWMNSFTRGEHEYVIPATPASYSDPVPADAHLRDEHIDAVILQRTEEIELTAKLLGRRPGKDIAAVFLEHNTPKLLPVTERHPLADQREIPIVHVTHFNRLVWDCGNARTSVIEHGIVDSGLQYTGEIPALGVVINEPVRRGRVTGTDLLPQFSRAGRLDCFGIDVDQLPAALELGPDRLQVVGDLPTASLHQELARRRAYLHPLRWTSLGLSLLEAMTLGMPVIAVASTEAARAVPPTAGAISADPDELVRAAKRLLADPSEARERGRLARNFALEHYGLDRFLNDWTALLTDLTSVRRGQGHAADSPRERAHPSPRTPVLTTEGATP